MKEFFKEQIKSIPEKKPSTTVKDGEELDSIGEQFELMNRDEELQMLFKYYQKHYTTWVVVSKRTTGREGKKNYSVPTCYGASGMGKTTLFSSGMFQKMLSMYEKSTVQDEKDFSAVLKHV